MSTIHKTTYTVQEVLQTWFAFAVLILFGLLLCRVVYDFFVYVNTIADACPI